MKPEKHQSTNTPEQIRQDAEKLLRFVSMYCGAKHRQVPKKAFSFDNPRTHVRILEGADLCDACERLLRHAIVKRALCPLDPKPKCRHCPEHCYRPDYRESMDTVMKYAGPRSLFSKG